MKLKPIKSIKECKVGDRVVFIENHSHFSILLNRSATIKKIDREKYINVVFDDNDKLSFGRPNNYGDGWFPHRFAKLITSFDDKELICKKSKNEIQV